MWRKTKQRKTEEVLLFVGVEVEEILVLAAVLLLLLLLLLLVVVVVVVLFVVLVEMIHLCHSPTHSLLLEQ